MDALVAKIEQLQATTSSASFKSDQFTDFGGQALSEWTMRGAVQGKTPGVWFRQILFVERHDQAFSRW